MTAKTTLAIGLLALTPAGMWLAACGSGDDNAGSDSGTGMDGTVADSGTNVDTGVMDTGGNTDTGTGQDSGGNPGCNKADSGPQCRQCCRNAHMTGVTTLTTAERTCVCSGNKCPQCTNNFCDGGNANQNCNNCVGATLNPDGGACFAPVTTACQQVADCVALLNCLNSCP